MKKLSELPNIGKVIEKQLNDIGIFTSEDLRKIGSKKAWLAIKEKDPSACYNRLCGLEGAIENIRWFDLSEEIKKELKDFYSINK